MKKQALLVIGDRKVNKRRLNRSFVKFVRYARGLKDKVDFELNVIDYARLFSGKVPEIDSPLIKIILFFPYQYWNQNIEVYGDGRVYGDRKFGQAFKILFKKVRKVIDEYYKGKIIKYLNSPEACYLDRDKKATKELLRIKNVPTPATFNVSSFDDIQRLIDRSLSLYIKPRFGAMGKGITYIDSEKVVSNFIFRKGRVISRPYDYNWRFTRIKDSRRFLNQLLKKDFVCEEAIQPATFRGKRFDFRIYVIFNNVVYKYAKSSRDNFYVTNWSQGGKIDRRGLIFKSISTEKIAYLERLAKRAASALGLNFAGIDVIFSKDLKDAYVLEGNAFPGYEKGFDLMRCLLNYMLK